MDDSDKIYDNQSKQKSSATDLKEAENSSSSEQSVDNESDKLGKGYTSSGKPARNGFLSKLKGTSKKKWLVGGLLGSGLGMVVILVILLMIASSLKIPNLAQHITAYEFARITRQFSDNAKRITSEKLVLSSTLDANSKLSFTEQVKAKYPSLAKASATLDKLNSYKPEGVIKTLGQENNLRLNFTNSKFTGSTLGGNTYSMKSAGKITGKVPLLRDVIDFKGQLQFSRDFAPAMDSAMKLNDVGPIIRGATARQVRQRLGIGLIAWNLGKFQGKTAEEARLVEEKSKLNAIEPEAKPTIKSNVSEISDTSEKVVQNEAKIRASDVLLKEAIDNNGVSPSTQAIIDKGLEGSIFKTVLDIGSPFYAIALPVCIVFDGSITNSDGTINSNTQKQQAAFYYIASAADKQKEGSNNNTDSGALATAIGATNLDLGDITNSVPEVRASGGNLDSVGAGISAESSASGQYSLFNVVLGNDSAFASFATSLVEPACKKLTDPKLAVGFLAANIVANIFSLGGATVAEQAAQAGSKVIVNKVTQTLTEKLVSKVAAKATGKVAENEFTFAASKGGRVFNFIYGNVKSVGKVVGATVMAKLLVMQQSGILVSGFAQGEDLANMAASGGNIQAGELSRQQLFGRPLTSTEIAQSDQADNQYVAYQNQSKSFTDRYFATSNANSLVSHMAMGVSASVHTGFIASMIRIASSLLHPLTYLGSFVGIVNQKVIAATDTSNLHFGNVQFGWSQAEENLINNDPSYQPLENQVILDDSGHEAEIAKTYAKCFGYTSDDNGSLTPISTNSGEGTLGDLFAKSMMKRDENGNVIADDSLCSPTTLGQNMVMRWRLAMSYITTIDQLTGLQDVTN